MARTEMKTSDISTEFLLTLILEYRGRGTWNKLIELGYPEKIIGSAFMREDRAGRITYGTSLIGSWVTPEGEEWLKEQRAKRGMEGLNEIQNSG